MDGFIIMGAFILLILILISVYYIRLYMIKKEDEEMRLKKVDSLLIDYDYEEKHNEVLDELYEKYCRVPFLTPDNLEEHKEEIMEYLDGSEAYYLMLSLLGLNKVYREKRNILIPRLHYSLSINDWYKELAFSGLLNLDHEFVINKICHGSFDDNFYNYDEDFYKYIYNREYNDYCKKYGIITNENEEGA